MIHAIIFAPVWVQIGLLLLFSTIVDLLSFSHALSLSLSLFYFYFTLSLTLTLPLALTLSLTPRRSRQKVGLGGGAPQEVQHTKYTKKVQLPSNLVLSSTGASYLLRFV